MTARCLCGGVMLALLAALAGAPGCTDGRSGTPEPGGVERSAAAPSGADHSDGAREGLAYRVVTDVPEGMAGGRVIVLLHGYGSQGEAYLELARAFLDGTTRVVLPTAPSPHASGRGAMWWEFSGPDWPRPWSTDPTANAWPETSQSLARARASVAQLVARLRADHRPDVVVIAGHSQGGMLALDVGLRLDPPPDRVASVAGYLLIDTARALDEAGDAGARPPVLVVHGRRDEVVPFAFAELLRDVLEQHGYPVVFAPHAGGHGVDAGVVRELRAFLLE